jgi:mercuric ion binding protein
MNLIKILLILISIFALPVTAQADQQTVTLNVEGMTCQSCPYQVKSALKRVEGVVSASASLEKREAEVIFDDAVTNIATLTQATTDVGFPSTLKP